MSDDLVEVYRNATEQLCHVISETPERIKVLNQIITDTELEIMDLLHLAEFENFNASEGYKIAFQIKDARSRRRAAKDEVEKLLTMKAAINSTSQFKPHLLMMQKAIGTRSTNLDKRMYTPRIRTDLTERFNRAKHK